MKHWRQALEGPYDMLLLLLVLRFEGYPPQPPTTPSLWVRSAREAPSEVLVAMFFQIAGAGAASISIWFSSGFRFEGVN